MAFLMHLRVFFKLDLTNAKVKKFLKLGRYYPWHGPFQNGFHPALALLLFI